MTNTTVWIGQTTDGRVTVDVTGVSYVDGSQCRFRDLRIRINATDPALSSPDAASRARELAGLLLEAAAQVEEHETDR